MNFFSRLRAFVREDEGQDLLEYALLIALIALVCVGAVALAGTKVSVVFENIAGAIRPAPSSAAHLARTAGCILLVSAGSHDVFR